MGKRGIIQSILLLLTVALVAAITSLFWFSFREGQQIQFRSVAEGYESRINILKRQSRQQTLEQRKLMNTLTQEQDDRLETEKELAKTVTLLEGTSRKLSGIEDWESYYVLAKSENDGLKAKLGDLKSRHNIELRDLENKLILLDLDMDAIHENYTLDQLQLSQAYENTIKKLKTDLEKSKQKSAQLKRKLTSAPVKSSVEKKKEYNNYRTARLKSLGSAMKDRASSDRKAILASVIPTIPEGISGNELALLLPGMSSEDILSVIMNIEKHIKRPLDENTLDRITRTMEKDAAVTATDILSK